MPTQAKCGKLKGVGAVQGQPQAQPACIGPLEFEGRDKAANAYFASAVIQGESVQALVDSGAMVTMISETFCATLPSTLVDHVGPDQLQYEGVVAGSKLDVVGSITVPIRIGEFISEPHRILVVAGIYSPCILGLDFLDRFYISIDAAGRQLVVKPPNLGGTTIELHTQFLSSTEPYRAINRVRLQIAPRSVALIQVAIRDLDQDMEGCIECLDREDLKFMVPRSLHAIREGHTYIDCVNVTDNVITIQRDQKVGFFTPMSQLCGVLRPEAEPPKVGPGSAVQVEELFDLDHADLTTEQKLLARDLIRRHTGVVGASELDLGLTDTVTHTIDIENSGPIKQRYRRFPEPLKTEIRGELDKLLDRKIIEPSHSAWSSPLVPVRKKNGKLRLCIDYRAVNAHTRKDSFPLPHLNDAIGRFKGSVYFSTLDLLSGYHQIAMAEQSKEITAFSSGEDLYQFCRMPFGITNGPASFSRLMSVVLSGVPMDVAQAYLDDVLVSGRDFEDHLRNLDLVLTRLREHGLKVSPEKCALFRTEVDYLGHRVSKDGIQPLEKNVVAIRDFPRPSTLRQLRSFLGMVNFYKKFIPNSETMLKPLYEATAGKPRKLPWSPGCEEAFVAAKSALTEAPVLAYPDFGEGCTFYVTCDASGTGVGAVLSQNQEGQERTIAFAGTSFNEAQSRYSTTDRELAGIRFAVTHFKPYLYGRDFVVRTDHEPLIYLHRMKRFDNRVHRTMEDLNIGNIEFQYLPGKNNTVADALSRAPYPWVLYLLLLLLLLLLL